MAVKRDIRPAAFGGRGWRPRRGTLADDIREGRVWASCGLNSEYGRLREVVLYRPPARTPPPADPNAVQHLERVDWARVAGEIGRAAACFRRLGVDVLALRPRLGRTAFKPEDCPNLVFVRDLFFMTPQGAIVSRMASAVRAGEERHLARALAERGVPILGTIAGSGTFEGADALWLRPGLVAVGLGNRTNAAGFGQLSDILRRLGAACLPVSLPPGVQHLLGCLQVVDGDLAAVRPRLLPQAARRRLAEEGFETVPLPEDDEVGRRTAMNFVAVSPRRVVMAAGCPATRRRLEAAGIAVAAEVSVSELAKAAGGLGCAAGILGREPV